MPRPVARSVPLRALRAWSALVLAPLLAVPASAGIDVANGTYVGNGTSLAVNGLGFAPEVVILRGPIANGTALIRTRTMVNTKAMVNNQFPRVDQILSLDADGFTIGDQFVANPPGETVHWIALGGVDDTFAVGTYVGDDAPLRTIDISDTSTSPDFEPTYVATIPDSQIRPLQSTVVIIPILIDNTTFQFSSSFISDGEVDAFLPNGYVVTDGNSTNAAGTTYHYFALRESENVVAAQYTSFGFPSFRSIGTLFEPVFVLVTRELSGGTVRMRLNTHPDGESYGFGTNSSASDAILSFFQGGFRVGTGPDTFFATERVRFLAIGLNEGPRSIPGLPLAGAVALAVALGAGGWIRLRAQRD